jgi:hypothetical protein
MNMSQKTGQADVTDIGIIFKNYPYSCMEAVSGRWFEKAIETGTWKVRVAFDENNLGSILILSEESHTWFEARIVDNYDISNAKLTKYFRSIQKLKNKRAQLV